MVDMNKPIPCVGFELLYSPLDRDCVENLAQSLHTRSNEFIFDVVQKVEQGQEMLMLFSNKHGPTEHLIAEVIKCTMLSDDEYQVTLKTRSDAGVVTDSTDLICLPINKGPATAREISLVCPCCHNMTSFQFIATQDGDWEKGILPIYNCASCGTTRAMIGLLTTNAPLSNSAV